FLVYSGDPVKAERHALGWWVMAFLVLFTIVVVLLKKEYWRDVH
ncbi:cytochrome c1, partial [Vibrio vulnificus]|nr:cytochrome c1 [Vibrio vulnificus]